VEIKYTKHASEMLAFRGIKKEQVEATIKNPDNRSKGKNGKSVLYKNFGINYLKVVIAEEKDAVIVITNHWIVKKRIKK